MLQNIPGRPLIGTTKYGGFSRTLDAPGAGTVLVHRNYPLVEAEALPPPPNVPHCMTDVLPHLFPKSSQAIPGAASAGSVITTSIDEGVEVDLIDRRGSEVGSVSGKGISSFSNLGIQRSDLSSVYGGRNQSFSSVASETLSPCASIDSSLGIEVSSLGLSSLQQYQQLSSLSAAPYQVTLPSNSDAVYSSASCGNNGSQNQSLSPHLLSLYPSTMLSHLTAVSGGGPTRHGRYSISGPSGPSSVSPLPPHPSMPHGSRQFLQVTITFMMFNLVCVGILNRTVNVIWRGLFLPQNQGL